MTRSRTTGNDDTRPDHEAAFHPVRMALERNDPQTALDELGRLPHKLYSYHIGNLEAWFNRKFALPSDDRHPWPDDQGMNRLIWMIWPTLPIKTICEDPEMIKTMLAPHHVREYWRRYPDPDGSRAIQDARTATNDAA